MSTSHAHDMWENTSTTETMYMKFHDMELEKQLPLILKAPFEITSPLEKQCLVQANCDGVSFFLLLGRTGNI